MTKSPPTQPFTLHCFDCIMNALCHVIAEKGLAAYIAGPLVTLIWSRMRLLADRFARLAARGPLPPRPRQPGAAHAPRAQKPRQPHRLPRARAWLRRLLPDTAFAGTLLQQLLADPEFAAIVAGNPGLGRILRPLCRALGVRPPPAPAPAPIPAAYPCETAVAPPSAPPPRHTQIPTHDPPPFPA